MSIDRIYYINLESRKDRNEHMQMLIKQLNLPIPVERIDAVDGQKLSTSEINKYLTPAGIQKLADPSKRFGVDLTLGGVGCALSHRKIWENIVTNNYNSVLILEDDIELTDNLYDKYKKISLQIPLNFDVVFLGYHPTSNKYIRSVFSSDLVKSDRVYGLFGYIVSLKGAKKLLNMFPIDVQIDSVISNNMNQLDAYLVKPENKLILSVQSEYNTKFGSNIQVEIVEHFGNTNLFILNNLIIVLLIAFVITIIYIIKQT